MARLRGLQLSGRLTRQPDEQRPLMDAMNDIIAVNWQAKEPHWTAALVPVRQEIQPDPGLRRFRTGRVLGLPQAADRRPAGDLPKRHRGASGPSGSRPLRVFHRGNPEDHRARQKAAMAASSMDGAPAIPSYGPPTPGSASRLRPRCSATPWTLRCRRPASRCAGCSIRARASKCPA